MRKKLLKKAVCVLSCGALMASIIPPTAYAAETPRYIVAPDTPLPSGPNVTYDGSLIMEAHLDARMGYPIAYYGIYVYAPSDVTGIKINNNDVVSGDVAYIGGSVREITQGTGQFESVSIEVTLYYANKSPEVYYETVNVNHWCGVSHPRTNHCK